MPGGWERLESREEERKERPCPAVDVPASRLTPVEAVARVWSDSLPEMLPVGSEGQEAALTDRSCGFGKSGVVELVSPPEWRSGVVGRSEEVIENEGVD